MKSSLLEYRLQPADLLENRMSELQPSPQTLEFYSNLRERAAVLSLGSATQIALTGADRGTFLNAFCTADIKKLQPGHGAEAFITNHQGKAAGHVLVLAAPEQLLLCGAPGQAEKLIAHLDRFLISERVEFQDQSAEISNLLLAGPAADDVLSQLTFNPLPTRWQHTTCEIAGRDVRCVRVDFLLPLPAFLMSVPREHAERLQAELSAAGANIADQATSAAVWNMARVEAGYPLFGQDISEANLPQEVCRNERAISFTKGCYLGQETIARLDALGHVNRVLTGLKLPADTTLRPGDVIQQGEKKIAQITSIAWSPKLQQPLALAYVRTLLATPGNKIAVAGGEAEVVKLPLE